MEIDVQNVEASDLTREQRVYLAMRVFQYLDAECGISPGRVVVKGGDGCEDEIVEQHDEEEGSR